MVLTLIDPTNAFDGQVRRAHPSAAPTPPPRPPLHRLVAALPYAHSPVRRQVFCRRDGDDQAFDKSIDHFEPSADPDAHARKQRYVIIDDREDAWCVPPRSHVLPWAHALCAALAVCPMCSLESICLLHQPTPPLAASQVRALAPPRAADTRLPLLGRRRHAAAGARRAGRHTRRHALCAPRRRVRFGGGARALGA